MYRFLLVLVLLVLGMGTYYYFYFRRMAAFWKLPLDKRAVKIGLLATTLLILLPLLSFSGLLALAVLHMFFFGLALLLLNPLLRRFSVWRTVFQSGLLPIIITTALLTYGWFNMQTMHATHYTVESGKLTAPMRVVFLSDLHYPNSMDAERLSGYCDEISALEPDIVLLGGDLFDESTEKSELQEALSLLGGIDTTHGIYAVYGNHDRSFYSASPNYTPQELADAMTRNHIQLLQDAAVTIGEVTVIGREDHSQKRASMADLLTGISPGQFLLVLDHQPTGSEENAALGCDLMLSGHAHNGQIWPIGYINALIGPSYGEYTFGNMKTIVSSGMVGWAYPVRTQGVCEYVVVELVPGT